MTKFLLLETAYGSILARCIISMKRVFLTTAAKAISSNDCAKTADIASSFCSHTKTYPQAKCLEQTESLHHRSKQFALLQEAAYSILKTDICY